MYHLSPPGRGSQAQIRAPVASRAEVCGPPGYFSRPRVMQRAGSRGALLQRRLLSDPLCVVHVIRPQPTVASGARRDRDPPLDTRIGGADPQRAGAERGCVRRGRAATRPDGPSAFDDQKGRSSSGASSASAGRRRLERRACSARVCLAGHAHAGRWYGRARQRPVLATCPVRASKAAYFCSCGGPRPTGLAEV